MFLFHILCSNCNYTHAISYMDYLFKNGISNQSITLSDIIRMVIKIKKINKKISFSNTPNMDT